MFRGSAKDYLRMDALLVIRQWQQPNDHHMFRRVDLNSQTTRTGFSLKKRSQLLFSAPMTVDGHWMESPNGRTSMNIITFAVG